MRKQALDKHTIQAKERRTLEIQNDMRENVTWLFIHLQTNSRPQKVNQARLFHLILFIQQSPDDEIHSLRKEIDNKIDILLSCWFVFLKTIIQYSQYIDFVQNKSW